MLSHFCVLRFFLRKSDKNPDFRIFSFKLLKKQSYTDIIISSNSVAVNERKRHYEPFCGRKLNVRCHI